MQTIAGPSCTELSLGTASRSVTPQAELVRVAGPRGVLACPVAIYRCMDRCRALKALGSHPKTVKRS